MTQQPTDHPLDNVNGTEHPTFDAERSIVDIVLDLDDFLSADVRLAESSARFCIDPAIEVRIEELNQELNQLTDSQGRPLPVVDQAVDDDARSAQTVALELQQEQRRYGQAMRAVRMRQMDEDDWIAFMAKHKKAMSEGPPFPAGFYEELIVKSAIAPKFSVSKLQEFRKKVGHPAFNELAQTAWNVNTQAGVSIPKSSLSSAVLRHQQLG